LRTLPFCEAKTYRLIFYKTTYRPCLCPQADFRQKKKKINLGLSSANNTQHLNGLFATIFFYPQRQGKKKDLRFYPAALHQQIIFHLLLCNR
jgi:hypothetical protein